MVRCGFCSGIGGAVLTTTHMIHFGDARELTHIPNESIDLVVTSPPYPMIEMWDEVFSDLNPKIGQALAHGRGRAAFDMMHYELDKAWQEVVRVLKEGGWVCINIGDATRRVGDGFQLYSNHSRITSALFSLGLDSLPIVLWRKQINAPNKFMGSGMLPTGAYVTLEHEYILIFRKGKKRMFSTTDEKQWRHSSSYFWEERNTWFSDIWDFKGIRQQLNHSVLRERSAAFPFELACRLINMYSVRQDTVLDPFLGTGTTSFAAVASCRNSVGVEIDPNFRTLIREGMEAASLLTNHHVSKRLHDHLRFVQHYKETKGNPKHRNRHYGFPVVTSQEVHLTLNYVLRVEEKSAGSYRAKYDESPVIRGESPLSIVSEKAVPPQQQSLLF
jgi:DNA modification methylase